MRAAPSLPPEPAAGAVGSQGAPLIAHVIYRLDVGGLENGLVNLIDRIPARWSGLKAAARRYVETEHNWKASVTRYEDVYARVTQPRRRA